MNKFKRFGVSILSLGLVLALNPVTTFAAEPETSVVTSESNAIGGWSEEDGYFVNPQAYSKAMEDGTTYASPKHTGKQKNVHTMVHLKKEHMVGLLGLENITTQEQEWKTGVQFLLILDVNGELTEQKQYLLGGVLTVILQDLLEPITEVDSSQTKKQRIVKSFAFFTIFFLRSLL